MEYRRIPALDREVSVLALGCEGFLERSPEEFNAMIDEAQSLGINFIDMYSPDPQFRRRLGKKIHDHREDWVLQSHLCSIWENDSYIRSRNIKKVKEHFERMLQELDTDYIDVGMIHYCDSQKDFDEIFNGPIYAYARELKEQGRIRSIGLSSHNPVVAREAVEKGYIDVLMFSINAAYDMVAATEDVNDFFEASTYEMDAFRIEPEREALYEACERCGVAIDVMKAYGGGDLLDASLSPFKKAFTAAQCVEYCLTRPGVVAVMAGVHSVEQLKKLAGWLEADEAEKDYASVLRSIEKFEVTGNCLYCTHCYPCTKKIRIADVNKFLALSIAQGSVPETVQQHYDSLEHKASECIECGVCETRCPFGVSIIEKMKQAADLFEQ